ncbi:MAG: AMP-binding protein, partial [Bacteroidota bacterium]
LLVHRKLRARTGGALRFFVSGGAALPSALGEFFEAAGLTILEGYGLTESSPVLSVNRPGTYRFGCVGPPIPGVEIRIGEEGEILARGPNIMKGYWGDEAATREVLDGEGWLHTGDIGRLEPDGSLRITDRKKHIFVSSGGKNIAPQPVENLLLQSPLIEHILLVGDRRPFLAALIVPDFEALRSLPGGRAQEGETAEQLVRRPEVRGEMEREVRRLLRGLPPYERVRRFEILHRPFTVEGGELTPTLKIRRRVVEERFAGLIEGMYARPA